MRNNKFTIVLAASCLTLGSAAYAPLMGKTASSHPAQSRKTTCAKPPAKSDEDRAIELVEAQKEVKEWLKLFPNGTSKATGGHPGFSVDAQSKGVFSVQVFEDKPDQNVTFGFYTVNLKTKKVTKDE